jgi:hypothetical protein
MRISQAGVIVWTCLLYGGFGSALAAEPSEDTAPSADAGPSLEERAQEILSAPAEDEKAAVRCIRSMDYDRVEVLDDLRVVFHGRGDKRWLNQLRIRCPGLRKRDTLQFEMRSMRLCEMDSFRSIDPSGFGMPGASCSLGSFEPVSPGQVQMLKDALRAERDARRKSAE